MNDAADWKIYQGDRVPKDDIERLPAPPPWRPRRCESWLGQEREWPKNPDDEKALPPAMLHRGKTFHSTKDMVESVNAAIYLRRPLLVTGKPGSGKSSLIDAVAYELRLGAPLRWAVTSRSSLHDALYQYDAIGRLQKSGQVVTSPVSDEAKSSVDEIGKFITLGPLGTALLPTKRPRALLIDEIDKGDIDLANDLLNVFEEGEFEIPELKRLGTEKGVEVFTSDRKQERAFVKGGVIQCCEFPVMVLTSNGEREFPAPFLRRCLRLQMPNPTGSLPEDDNDDWKRLKAIVNLHFGPRERDEAQDVIRTFEEQAKSKDFATDQLLNAIYFVMASKVPLGSSDRDTVIAKLRQELVSAFG